MTTIHVKPWAFLYIQGCHWFAAITGATVDFERMTEFIGRRNGFRVTRE